jgi:acyl carrier protein
MTTKEIEAKEVAIIAEKLAMNPADIGEGTRLREDLTTDSLEVVEIVLDVEHALGVDVPESALRELPTVGALVAYIASERAKAA